MGVIWLLIVVESFVGAMGPFTVPQMLNLIVLDDVKLLAVYSLLAPLQMKGARV